MKSGTYVDAVRVRFVIIGLGNCKSAFGTGRLGELSGEDIVLFGMLDAFTVAFV